MFNVELSFYAGENSLDTYALNFLIRQHTVTLCN